MISRSFPVAINTRELQENGKELYFPQVVGLESFAVEETINEQIEQTVFQLVSSQKEQQNVETFDQMIGLYEIKTNERNVLSMTLTNYAIHEYFAHGLTIMASLNFDVKTGENWTLSDQFQPDSDYQTVLTEMVNKQIKERDFPVFEQPITVESEQDYYIADKALVLYYQLYAISPYYVGLPMFPISVYSIEDILRDDSLLARMLP